MPGTIKTHPLALAWVNHFRALLHGCRRLQGLQGLQDTRDIQDIQDIQDLMGLLDLLWDFQDHPSTVTRRRLRLQ